MSESAALTPTAARAAFALRLARIYGREVPLYTTLVEVCQQVNQDVVAARGEQVLTLGGLERVTAERHGAIRVGTAEELNQVGRIFAAMGMYPVGFYDLREAAPDPVPVVSTAFRPVTADELEFNPFRVFTSVLVADDPRFFDPEMQAELAGFLARRTLFPPELLTLADRLTAEGELPAPLGERFLDLAAAAFELSREPVDRAWYRRLEQVSSVAADIGGVGSTHINHLTPRVLDIDELYRRMTDRGVTMIPAIQGPPRWGGPDVLLRQTSFRALDETRPMRFEDGTVGTGTLRVRFGEVEQRAIALTPTGRDLVEQLDGELARRLADLPEAGPGERREVAAQVWRERLPGTETGLIAGDLGYFRFRAVPGAGPWRTDAAPTGPTDPTDQTDQTDPTGRTGPVPTVDLVRAGLVQATPIVYEDFLPRSAAGIFSSNLTGAPEVDTSRGGSVRDAAWMAQALGRPVADAQALYAQQSRASLVTAAEELRLDPDTLAALRSAQPAPYLA